MPSEESADRIYLVTENNNHEYPDEFSAFASREAAEQHIESLGVDVTDLKEYNVPGVHEAASIPGERRTVSIRELEVEDGA